MKSRPSLEDSAVIREIDAYQDLPASVRPTARAAIVAKFPEIASDLQACLLGLDVIHDVVPELVVALADGKAESAPEASEWIVRRELGDFRLVREIGRGGMGVVYEAIQSSLGRRVAVKVLPLAPFMRPQDLQRFKQEAHAAAVLRHPNIVNVHCVGVERGVHYYAMELVEGVSLEELVAALRANQDSRHLHHSRGMENDNESELPTGPPPGDTSPIGALSTQYDTEHQEYFRTIARLGATVADAIHYAHQQGIVHRDLKPSNLLLDVNGNPWITDFGLAQMSGDHGITLTGDMLGTLRYMSPEQAEGKKLLDHRTDIYSLGVTLYELLTLQSALPGSDRAELLRRLENHRPAEARSADPRVPIEFETILLKAMATEPENRYASAQEFADDLRRFVDNRPPQARRSTSGQQIVRWIRRNRRVSAALAAGFGVISALALGTTMAARQYAILARSEANLRIQAEQNRERLQTLLGNLLTTAVETLENLPGIDRKHEELLNKTVAQYQSLLESSPDDPHAQHQVALGLIRLGRVYNFRLDVNAADQMARTALEIMEDLTQKHPENIDFQFAEASACCMLATIRWGKEIDTYARRAVRIMENVVQQDPDDPVYLEELAFCRERLASQLSSHGAFPQDDQEVMGLMMSAGSTLDELRKRFPQNQSYDSFLGYVKDGISRHHLRYHRWELAEIAAREALALYALQPEPDERARYDVAKAETLRTLGESLLQQYRYAEAEDPLRKAHDILTQLLSGFGEGDWMLHEACLCRRALAQLYRVQSRDEESAAMWSSILELLDRVPEFELRHVYFRSTSHFELGELLWKSNPQEARGHFNAVLSRTPLDAITATRVYGLCSDVALRDPQKALTTILQEHDPIHEPHWGLVGLAQFRLGAWEEAKSAFQQVLDADPDNAGVLFLMAMIYHQCKNTADSQRFLESAQKAISKPRRSAVFSFPYEVVAIQAEAHAMILDADAKVPTIEPLVKP